MNKVFTLSAIFPAILITFISIFFIPAIIGFYANQGVIVNFKFPTSFEEKYSTFDVVNSSFGFIWPTTNYKNITSSFGYRIAPATGASSYHGAIDIGAPQGTPILALADGKITFAGWNGANGYTVKIDYGNGISSTYGHVSPDLLVSVGESVSQGDIVAKVGPKYVEKKSYTTYTDSSGKCTNGATTGPHLHFAVSKNGKRINPQTLYQ